MWELCQTGHPLQLASRSKSILGILTTIQWEQSSLAHGG